MSGEKQPSTLRLAGRFFLWLLLGSLCSVTVFVLLLFIAPRGVGGRVIVTSALIVVFALPGVLGAIFGYRVRRSHGLSAGSASFAALGGAGLLVLLVSVRGIIRFLMGLSEATVEMFPVWLFNALLCMVLACVSSAFGAWWARRREGRA